MTNDFITVDEMCGWGGGFVCTSKKFAPFMTLKGVICTGIGSDCVENVNRLGGLGWRRGAGDVDVCPNGGVGAVVARFGIAREQYVKWSCRGVGLEMEQLFHRYGSVRVEITGLCQDRR